MRMDVEGADRGRRVFWRCASRASVPRGRSAGLVVLDPGRHNSGRPELKNVAPRRGIASEPTEKARFFFFFFFLTRPPSDGLWSYLAANAFGMITGGKRR